MAMPSPFSTRGMKTRTRDAVKVADGAGMILRVILQSYLYHTVLRLVAFDELVVEDITLLEEDAGYLFLDLRRRNLYHAVACHDGIANPAQIICYGICHCCDV